MGDRAFSGIAPKMWNDLDVCIREPVVSILCP